MREHGASMGERRLLDRDTHAAGRGRGGGRMRDRGAIAQAGRPRSATGQPGQRSLSSCAVRAVYHRFTPFAILQSYVLFPSTQEYNPCGNHPVCTEHTPETLAGGARPPSTTTIMGVDTGSKPVNMNHNKDNHMRTHRPAASADNVASHAGVTHLLGGRAASSIAMRAGEGRPPRREARGPHFSRRV